MNQRGGWIDAWTDRLITVHVSKNICLAGEKQEGYDGPVSLTWLIRKIPSYQALQYLGIGLKHRPLTRTKIGSHSSYVKHQENFERLYHMKPCKTCNPWQSIRP